MPDLDLAYAQAPSVTPALILVSPAIAISASLLAPCLLALVLFLLSIHFKRAFVHDDGTTSPLMDSYDDSSDGHYPNHRNRGTYWRPLYGDSPPSATRDRYASSTVHHPQPYRPVPPSSPEDTSIEADDGHQHFAMPTRYSSHTTSDPPAATVASSTESTSAASSSTTVPSSVSSQSPESDSHFADHSNSSFAGLRSLLDDTAEDFLGTPIKSVEADIRKRLTVVQQLDDAQLPSSTSLPLLGTGSPCRPSAIRWRQPIGMTASRSDNDVVYAPAPAAISTSPPPILRNGPARIVSSPLRGLPRSYSPHPNSIPLSMSSGSVMPMRTPAIGTVRNKGRQSAPAARQLYPGHPRRPPPLDLVSALPVRRSVTYARGTHSGLDTDTSGGSSNNSANNSANGSANGDQVGHLSSSSFPCKDRPGTPCPRLRHRSAPRRSTGEINYPFSSTPPPPASSSSTVLPWAEYEAEAPEAHCEPRASLPSALRPCSPSSFLSTPVEELEANIDAMLLQSETSQSHSHSQSHSKVRFSLDEEAAEYHRRRVSLSSLDE